MIAHARISVMYAHERLSDIATQRCLTEMYPKGKRIQFEESDGPCIIFCVFKKIGIMNANGQIDMDTYRRRLQSAHHMNKKVIGMDYGNSCFEAAETTPHKSDVCKKAKAFNECTHLYRMVFSK